MKNKRVYKISIVKSRITNYCALQDRCLFEVRQKLSEFGVLERTKNILISELIKDKFLDEERYVRSFCRGKFKIKKWGKQKIEFALKKKKISPTYIKKGMEEIDLNEYLDQLNTHLETKNKLIKDKNQFTRENKLAKYLINKGYESNLVWDKIKDIYNK